ncbi:hypothetical protein JCM33374_g2543 [Metschnikowia sp. JCM 33374]|nr:hypothetical protein JCM33374_g2543 [Metschnikowia sp. JCM 33374]
MSLSNPSLSWQKLQDVYYNIRTCYEELEWDLEDLHSNYRVAVSKNATLVALASRFVPHPNVITVYSLSGTKLWSLVYNSSTRDHIVDFAFYEERLCVVLANNKVRIYTDFFGTFDEYSCVDEAVEMSSVSGPANSDTADFKYVITNLEDNSTEEPLHVVETAVWGRFLMLRYIDHLSFVDLSTFVVYDVPFPSLQPTKIHSMCLLKAEDSTLSCIMSYDLTIYSVQCDFASSTYEFTDEHLTDGPFTVMSASANGQLVALLNAQTPRIFVTTKHFDKMLLEYDTSNESSLPFMMKWAGNDAIILSLRDEIKLIGPSQKSISFFYDIIDDEHLDFDKVVSGNLDTDLAFTIPIITTETDGLKIITRNKVEFLSRVPAASVNLYSVGSTHPSYILLDCVDKLASQASKADSNISLLNSEGALVDAINGCLNAALDEFSPVLQKAILKAASFGKIYVASGFNADNYLKVLNTLKVLNQIRSPEIGLFLTHTELTEIGWPSVIQMLLTRSLHLLALTIVELLDLQDCKPAIFTHWCCCKIRTEPSLADIDLFRIVSKKLLSARDNDATGGPVRNYIPTAEIFNVALQEGRIDLCKLLVNLEPSSVLRITQLLKIDEVDLALIKCFQTCDYDLCVLILRHLKKTLSAVEFQRVLNQNELVEVLSGGSVNDLLKDDEIKQFFQENLFISGNLIGNLWKQSTAKYDRELLEEFYKNGGMNTDLNLLQLKSYQESQVEESEASQFSDIYQSQKKELTRLASNKKLKSIIQPELDTLELRYRLSNTFQQSFFADKSVIDIIKKLIKMNQIKPAAKVVKEFRVSSEKFWNLVLEIYCKSKDFDRLNKFIVDSNSSSSSYKSPIGFEVIVETCLAYECPKDYVSTYISHCTESSHTQKAKLYMRNGDMGGAAEEAFNNKDQELLRIIQKSLNPEDGNVSDAITSYLNRLGA